jgi:hypothetical protein
MRRLVASVVIVIVFVVAAEHFVGWRSLVYPWLFIDDPLLILAAVALLGVTYVIRAFRVYRYFRLRSGFGSCVRLLLQHTFLVNVLPMRTGELAFPALMKRYFGMSIQRSVPALLWLRALDLHALLSVPIVLVAVTKNSMPAWLAVVAGVVWLGMLFVIYFCSQTLAEFAARRDTKVFRLAQSVLAAFPRSLGELIENWLLTMVNWTLKLAVFAWIIHAFSSQSYAPSLAGAIGGELSGILPIQGFANIGTYEAGVVAAMRAVGVTTSDALTGAVNLHFFVLGVSICGALLALLLPMPAASRDHREGVPGPSAWSS